MEYRLGKYTSSTIVLISFLHHQPFLINKLKTFSPPPSHAYPIWIALQYHKEYYNLRKGDIIHPSPPALPSFLISICLSFHICFSSHNFSPLPIFLPVHRLRLHWLENWKTLLKRYPQINCSTPPPTHLHFKINTQCAKNWHKKECC